MDHRWHRSESSLENLAMVTGGLSLGALSHQLALVRMNDLQLDSSDGVQLSDAHYVPTAHPLLTSGVHLAGSDHLDGYVGWAASPGCEPLPPPPDYSGPMTTPDGTILGPLGRNDTYGVVMDYDVGVAPGVMGDPRTLFGHFVRAT